MSVTSANAPFPSPAGAPAQPPVSRKVVAAAVAGNAIEGRTSQGYAQSYRITIQLDQGGMRAYDVQSPGDLRIGERVRLYNGQISRM